MEKSPRTPFVSQRWMNFAKGQTCDSANSTSMLQTHMRIHIFYLLTKSAEMIRIKPNYACTIEHRVSPHIRIIVFCISNPPTLYSVFRFRQTRIFDQTETKRWFSHGGNGLYIFSFTEILLTFLARGVHYYNGVCEVKTYSFHLCSRNSHINISTHPKEQLFKFRLCLSISGMLSERPIRRIPSQFTYFGEWWMLK